MLTAIARVERLFMRVKIDLYFPELLAVRYSFDVSTVIVLDLLPRVLVVRYLEIWINESPCTAVEL